MVPKSIIVVDPTHKDGDQLSQALRALRRAERLIEGEDKPFTRLVPLGWSPAEKRDSHQYSDEVTQFFRNTGPFKAGQRVRAAELVPQLSRVNPEYFQVYREEELRLAKGDTIRITAGGKTKEGHRVDNGRIDTIAGFTEKGEPILPNGWVLPKDFGHFKNGLVSTSMAVQSKTEDIVLASMNRASLGAMGAEQAYVTASRGRERGMIFTDLPREELLHALKRQDARMSATELMAAQPAKNKARWRQRAAEFVKRVQYAYRRLQERADQTIRHVALQQERRREGFSR
jgi:hypothetical protein